MTSALCCRRCCCVAAVPSLGGPERGGLGSFALLGGDAAVVMTAQCAGQPPTIYSRAWQQFQGGASLAWPRGRARAGPHGPGSPPARIHACFRPKASRRNAGGALGTAFCAAAFLNETGEASPGHILVGDPNYYQLRATRYYYYYHYYYY